MNNRIIIKSFSVKIFIRFYKNLIPFFKKVTTNPLCVTNLKCTVLQIGIAYLNLNYGKKEKK